MPPRVDVPGFGPHDAKIALVGEAPGETEMIERRPFVGNSGRLLNDMLARVGINRNDCYLTNVVKSRPPGNNFGVFYEEKNRKTPSRLLEASIRALQEELKTLNPNVVVALGDEPLRALTSCRGITKWRGSILAGTVGKTLATYHPAYLLRMYKHRAIVELDLKRAREESISPSIQLPQFDFQIEPSFDQVMDYLRSIRSGDKLAFDTETTELRVRCLGLSTKSRTAICIPFFSNLYAPRPGDKTLLLVPPSGPLANSYWDEAQELEILRELDRVFRDESVWKIAQNFPFDARVLAEDFGFAILGLWMDTMVAQHCCYPELPKSLDFLTSVYTRQPRYSDYDVENDYSTWRYNCFDTAITFEVAERLEVEMKQLDVFDFYRSLAQPAMLALAKASNTGMLINEKLRTERAKQVEGELNEVHESLVKSLGFPFNPSSPKQVAELLYDRLGLPAKIDRKTKSRTTKEEALAELSGRYPKHKELIDSILQFRQKRVLLGTFLTSTLGPGGRMYTNYHATGTVTGRISSSKTIDEIGGNLQNIPRGSVVRECFISDPRKVLVKVDLSQAEARDIAWLSRNRELIERFQDPTFDVHLANAAVVYQTPIDEITPHQRQQAKHVLHAADRQGGPRTAMKHAKIPYAQAKHALERYLMSRPDMVRWWGEVEAEIRTTRTLRNVHGRLRIFMDRFGNDLWRAASSFQPQSDIGDLINRAFAELDKRLPKGSVPLLQVHDEIVVQTDDNVESVERCMQIMRELLEVPLKHPGVEEVLIIPTEFGVGYNWFEAGEQTFEEWKRKKETVT